MLNTENFRSRMDSESFCPELEKRIRWGGPQGDDEDEDEDEVN